ncbi:MAG: ferrous iron transport protein B [Thermococci archaeon]|nr:ferrous iron transport protein B [Thermococci archaeon]
MGRTRVVALAGNPNVGKTTLFNALTGMRQHVGNWPGVTVEKKEGKFTYNGETFLVVDLPGTYSLTAHSIDEIITRNFLLNSKPDVVVNVVDVTALMRNLYLTFEILEMGLKNVVIALNKFDLAEKKGIKVDPRRMAEVLGVPVVPISAKSGEGLEELKETIARMARGELKCEPVLPTYDRAVEREIEHISRVLEGTDLAKRYSVRWLAVKLLQRDDDVMKLVLRQLGKEKLDEIMRHIGEVEERYGRSIDLVMASSRYEFIDSLLHRFVEYENVVVTSFTDQLDRVLTHPVYGLIALAIVFYFVFKFVFALGMPLQSLLAKAFSDLGSWLAPHITSSLLRGLVVQGIIGGVGTVLSFFPLVFLMFFALAVLEDTGYMARAALVLEDIMRKFGLSGKSFIPLILGFGCNVPAIMATRSIDDEKARLVTVLINSFIPCSARLSVISFITAVFFSSHRALVALSIYAIAVGVAFLMAWLLSRFVVRGERAPFVMELPEYAVPPWKTVLLHSWERSKEFIKKAGTVILGGAIFMWFLSNYPEPVGTGKSYAEAIGHFLAPYVSLMGLDWKAAVSLLFGVIAKENVIATYGVLYGSKTAIAGAMGQLQAYVLAVVTTLYVPCIATMAAIKGEAGWKWMFFTVAYMIAVASLVGILIWHVGTWL